MQRTTGHFFNHLKVFAIFAGLSVLLRLFSFFPTVINHDESTYIVIADALLRGHVYWVDYIDTKPIGIFLVYALLKVLFGGSIFVYRLVTALWLATTAFLLYRVKLRFGSQRPAGVAAGVIYLFLNSIFTFYGVSPNTETFFGLFTVAALFLLLQPSQLIVHSFLAGLLLGAGFLLKYVVAFDALAFGLLLIWPLFALPEKRLPVFFRASSLVAGFAIPILMVFGYYSAIGHEDTFLFYTFEVSSRYPVSATAKDYFTYLLDFFGRFLPVTFFFFYALLHKGTHQTTKYFGLLWSALVLTVVLLPGKFFGHYFIQFMLPFCFVAGEFFALPRKALPKWLRWLFQPPVGFTLLGLLLLVNLFLQKKDYFDKPDYPKTVAAYLKPKLKPADQIYTGNDAQIIYHLLERQSPIRYIHPSLFWEEKHIKALDIDRSREIRSLKAIAPRFIMVRDSLPISDGAIDLYLQEHYQLDKRFGERVFIYQKVE